MPLVSPSADSNMSLGLLPKHDATQEFVQSVELNRPQGVTWGSGKAGHSVEHTIEILS
jgi:hypothetical protein